MLPAIHVENLSKRYRLASTQGVRNYRTLRESIAGTAGRLAMRLRGRRAAPATTEFWALQDVSFDVAPGEVIGIIGPNGAGKSTLLKILSRIVKPTCGRAVLRGRVSSLLEVGTGFHPELTGRENIFLNGSVLGMSRREILARFDDIVSFAEVAPFLELPVKRYSSGMYLRLAFSVAAHLRTEVMIVDEVLAVGDHAFQDRCKTRMRDLGSQGRAVIVVSHDLAAISYLAKRALLITGGRLLAQGDPSDVIARYTELHCPEVAEVVRLENHAGREPQAQPLMTSVRVFTPEGGPLAMGATVTFAVEFAAPRPLGNICFSLGIKNRLHQPVLGVNNVFLRGSAPSQPVARGEARCTFASLPLVAGTYDADLYLGHHGENLDIIHNAIAFEVQPADVFGTGKLPPAAAGDVFYPAEIVIRETPATN